MTSFFADTLFLAGRDWLLPAAAGFGILLAAVAWSVARATGAPLWLRLGCALLKLLGAALLLACLLEPTWSGERARPGANLLAVVADNSLSMQLHGRGEAESRGDTLRQLLTGTRGGLWRPALAENFELRDYLADSRLQPTQDFHELTFDGRTSALGGALRNLAERHRGQPLAGVVLLTDGMASDLDEAIDPSGLPPIYPVVIGNEQPPRDLAIAHVNVTQSAFEDAPVTVQAELSVAGFSAGEEIVGKLFAIDPTKTGEIKPVAEAVEPAPASGDKLVFRFSMRPDKTGVLFYRLRFAAKAEWDAEKSTEATLANNETVVTVDRGSERHRILYVSGRPNWEYKFLHRAVEEDDQMALVGLIRVAKREPKFEFKGRSGEASNPLFRGFGGQSKEETESYDKPVLVRLGTEDEFELRDGFPKTPEDLFKYRAVIVDDVEAEFFSADQMSLLQRFVSERGGGFLMLGGAESFGEGKFGRTAIGDMLPVYVDRFEPAREGPVRFHLTREGSLEPWARLRQDEAGERRRLENLPPVEVLNRVRETKPAAMVVATVSDGSQEAPAIVTQRYGRGRTASLLVGDLWHTGLGDEAGQKDLGRQWRQIVRWLVADVPARVELRVEPQAGGECVRIQARVRDAKFEPLENAAVSLKISRGDLADALPVTLTAEADPHEAGLYEATFIPRESGGYRVEAAVSDEGGTLAGNAATGWSTDLPAAEFRDLRPNRALMESLARQSGGRMLSPEELVAFAQKLPTSRAVINETWTRPFWHTPWLFLAALGCLVGEWGLRRWKGLA